MKSLRTVRYSLIAAAVAGAAFVPTMAAAGVSATAGVASSYLWRGQNLGGGTPAVMGSLDYSHDSGLFAGVWGSSAGPGSETDLYVGYAYSSESFGAKVAVYDYTYPGNTEATLQEAYLNLSFSGAFLDYYTGIGEKSTITPTTTTVADLSPPPSPTSGLVTSTTTLTRVDSDYKDSYLDIGYTMDKVTAKVGMTMNDAAKTDYTHLDVTYAYNGNLAFTVSGVVDADTGAVMVGKKDPLFVVSYSLPLDLK